MDRKRGLVLGRQDQYTIDKAEFDLVQSIAVRLKEKMIYCRSQLSIRRLTDSQLTINCVICLIYLK